MTNERTNEKRAAPPRRRVVAASISTSPSSRPFRADVANERSDHACMTVYLNQSPRTPKRRLTGAACVVVTPFVRASSGGASAWLRVAAFIPRAPRATSSTRPRARRTHRNIFPHRAIAGRASSRASRRATTTDARRPRARARHIDARSHRRDGVRDARRVDARIGVARRSTRDGVQRATRGARDRERRDRGRAVDVLRGGVLVHRDEGAKGRDGRRDRATRAQGEGGAVGRRWRRDVGASMEATRRRARAGTRRARATSRRRVVMIM